MGTFITKVSVFDGIQTSGKNGFNEMSSKILSKFSLVKIYFTSLLISHKHECVIIMHFFDRIT